MSTKPILFNTEMVQAILDGRKTVTRRLVKFKQGQNPRWTGYVADGPVLYGSHNIPTVKAPYQAGDILYVRETWCKGRVDCGEETDGREAPYISQCSGEDDIIPKEWAIRENIGIEDVVWRPSIFMPKEAARIFLRVKDVRVERLQDITVEQVAAEGIDNVVPDEGDENLCNYCPLPNDSKGVHCYGGAVVMCEGSHCKEAMEYWEEEFIGEFAGLWESTIKDKDIGAYGWDANPWVWVIEFEKISKEDLE